MGIITQERTAVEHAIIRVLARADTLAEAAPEILSGICEVLGWDYSALWLLDPDSGRLACDYVWSRHADGERFEQASRTLSLSKGQGLPGEAWESGQAVWVADFSSDDRFPRRDVAEQVRLHGAFAFPIFVKDAFYGAMEFFSGNIQEPDEALLELVETVGAQIGDLIESERLEKELAFQKALLESQGEAALDGILLVSYEQRVLYYNQRLVQMWGVPEEVLQEGDAFRVNTYMAPKAADPSVFDEIGEAIRANPALERRDEIPLADGRIFDRWAAPVTSQDGRRLGRTVFYRDITTERRYAERLKRDEEWSTFVAEASTLFSQAFDVETIVGQLVKLAVPTLADWCSVSLADDRGLPRQVAYAHADPERVEMVARLQEKYPPAPDPDVPGEAQVLRDRQPLLMAEIPQELLERSAQNEEHLGLIRQLQLHSAMVVPLICRDRALGTLLLVSAESGRVFDENDLHRAMDLATRAAFPIDNARLYAETRVIAETLQKSFLPPELPDIAGVDITARYFPAGEGQLIGGDFYDAFRVDSKRWGLVLGDVSGKGLEAATVTTLARHTIRGAAFGSQTPSDALRVLNTALIEQQQTDRFCTAVYAIVEPRFARVRVTISCGGHPPPYVIRNDGRVEPIECGGTLLGFIDPVALRDAQVELEFGDKLFLYTDGVLDIRQKRGTFGPEGLEKLLYESSKRGTESAAEMISNRLAELQGGTATDDIAFIIIGVRSSVFNVAARRGRGDESDAEDE